MRPGHGAAAHQGRGNHIREGTCGRRRGEGAHQARGVANRSGSACRSSRPASDRPATSPERSTATDPTGTGPDRARRPRSGRLQRPPPSVAPHTACRSPKPRQFMSPIRWAAGGGARLRDRRCARRCGGGEPGRGGGIPAGGGALWGRGWDGPGSRRRWAQTAAASQPREGPGMLVAGGRGIRITEQSLVLEKTEEGYAPTSESIRAPTRRAGFF